MQAKDRHANQVVLPRLDHHRHVRLGALAELVLVLEALGVAGKELKLSCHNPEARLFTMYPCYGNSNKSP